MPEEALPTPGTTVSPAESLFGRGEVRRQTAWERLVTLYAPLVYHWCRQAGLPPPEAVRLSEEVFRTVLQGIAGFAGDRQGPRFQAWLRQLTDEKLSSRTSRCSHAWLRLNGSANATPIEEYHDQATVHDDGRLPFMRVVELVRGEFSASVWQAFWRVVVEVQDPEYVARALMMPLHSVYLAKVQVGRRLRNEFAGLLGV